jgi:hypothetical protein
MKTNKPSSDIVLGDIWEYRRTICIKLGRLVKMLDLLGIYWFSSSHKGYYVNFNWRKNCLPRKSPGGASKSSDLQKQPFFPSRHPPLESYPISGVAQPAERKNDLTYLRKNVLKPKFLI